jgi:hypothetical protein
MEIKNNPYLSERWYQIQSLLQKAADDGLKYLTLINGGGTIAVLSFIAANSENSNKCMWISFSIFFTSLILVGVINFWRYLHLSHMLKSWADDCEKIRKGEEIEYETLIANDNKRAYKADKIFYLAVICFILPVIGFSFGMMKILDTCFCN